MTSGSLRPLRMLFLGAPGSGKGTLTSRLLRAFPQVGSVSSGDLLRQQMAEKTEIGKLAAEYISRGELLPDEIMTRLLIRELDSRQWLTSRATWLLDGFPRTDIQAISLHSALKAYNADLNLVVELKVPESVILARIVNRYVHVPSGRVYNLSYNPPKVPGIDDVTGEPLSRRPDDTAEVFQRRLDKYHATLKPLREYYAQAGILKTVYGETSNIIFPQLEALVKDSFAVQYVAKQI
ncbi:LAMI_0H14994g1_1 [Lachancea mirantina]|uniref:GTP:AMP phosphotransferase, mitochondrial n=1 Tax=Lachancea mirantina TaxID=1230905 RepID=A0A1G4KIJ3_9SACH|nr:LAMI_0H14994g1_1 [Lachancea mirantina]